jgi:hypothetical protein
MFTGASQVPTSHLAERWRSDDRPSAESGSIIEQGRIKRNAMLLVCQKRFLAGVLFVLVAALAAAGFVPAQADEQGQSKEQAKSANKIAHRIVRVSGTKVRQPAEVSVAIDPLNLDHVVAVSVQNRRRGEAIGNAIYTTEDGGRSWQTILTANPENRRQGDDAVTFGPDGVAHHSYISFTGIRTDRPLRAANGIFISSCRDGATWEAAVPVVDHINSVQPFEDKPYLIVDGSVKSPYRGNLYVSWTRFDVYGSKDPAHKSHIYFSRSLDCGRSFGPVQRISDTPGDCRDSSNTVEGAMPAVGPKGEVYVAWAGPKGLVFKKSIDGGWSFTPEQVVAEISGGWDSEAPGLTRHNGLPVTAVDLSSGRNRGSIYAAWTDRRNKDLDVFLTASRDGGKTWSQPLRVNDDPRGNGKDQLFAWMAIDPADGSINILFYDRRDLEGTLTGLTLARSVDGGKTFVNHRLAQEPFRCYKEVFFGDYIGVAGRGGRVIGVYPHFISPKEVAISAAIFRFRPGSQETLSDGTP